VPGFVENRILYAILRECLDLVDRGIVDAAGLDTNVRWAIGYKLGRDRPDGAARHGRPRHLQGRRHLPQPELSTKGEVSSTILDLIDKGRLGMKTGGGLYDYTPSRSTSCARARVAKLIAVRRRSRRSVRGNRKETR